MAKKGVGAVASGAEVKDLIATKGRPSSSHRRLARLLDGDVFRGADAKEGARQRRKELHTAGHEFHYRRANLGGEIVYVVKDLGPKAGQAKGGA